MNHVSTVKHEISFYSAIYVSSNVIYIYIFVVYVVGMLLSSSLGTLLVTLSLAVSLKMLSKRKE